MLKSVKIISTILAIASLLSPSVPIRGRNAREGRNCLAPQPTAQQQLYSEGEDDGMLIGSVRLDPDKPLVLVMAMDAVNWLGPSGNTSNLFLGLRRNLPECNVTLLRLTSDQDMMFRNQVNDLYGPDTGIVTLEFLLRHPEYKVARVFMHKSEVRYTSAKQEFTLLRLNYDITVINHYSRTEKSQDQPSLTGKWIVPAQMEDVFFSVHDSPLSLQEQKRRFFDDMVLAGKLAFKKLRPHYAKSVSALDSRRLASRTLGVSYAHDLAALRNYLIMLAAMIEEKGMFENGITFLLAMHNEFLAKFLISAEPNREFNGIIASANSKIARLFPAADKPRVLLPNPEGEGYIYYSTALTETMPESEVTDKDILLIPSPAMPQKDGFFRAMALSAMEKGNWIPPLMSGDGSYTAASALDILTGLPALHDASILHLWRGMDYQSVISFILNPRTLPLIEFIARYHPAATRFGIDLDNTAELFSAGLRVDRTRYERFLRTKDITRVYAEKIRSALTKDVMAQAA